MFLKENGTRILIEAFNYNALTINPDILNSNQVSISFMAPG